MTDRPHSLKPVLLSANETLTRPETPVSYHIYWWCLVLRLLDVMLLAFLITLALPSTRNPRGVISLPGCIAEVLSFHFFWSLYLAPKSVCRQRPSSLLSPYPRPGPFLACLQGPETPRRYLTSGLHSGGGSGGRIV